MRQELSAKGKVVRAFVADRFGEWVFMVLHNEKEVSGEVIMLGEILCKVRTFQEGHSRERVVLYNDVAEVSA